MKSTLINCSVQTSKIKDGAQVPLGCLYLLAAAEKAGYYINFKDYEVERLNDPLDTSTFVDFITDDSDLIAISCMSNLLPLVVESTRILKEQYPEKKVLLGGIGPSGVAAKLMATFPHIDIIAVGEGEETFVDLLHALETKNSINNIAGILYRKSNGSYQITQQRFRINHLDELEPPAYHRLNIRRYENVGVQTIRGCPFSCKFCDVSNYWGRHVTYRSNTSVMDELECLEKQHGVNLITIIDDTFTLSKQRAITFCQSRSERNLKFNWSALCRVDLMDEGLIETFATSGCCRVFLGIESGSKRVLEYISKCLEYHHLILMINKMVSLFEVHCNFIWGFPFETMNDLKETIYLLFYLQELGCKTHLTLLSPLPLSPLYKEKKYKLMLQNNLQSSVVSSRFRIPNSILLSNGKPRDLVKLIQKYPEIFPGFYNFADELFEKKLNYLYSMGFKIEELVRP